MAKLPPGVSQRHNGYRAIAIVGRGARKEKLFPLTTPIREIVAWLEDTRSTLRKGAEARPKGSMIEELESTYLTVKEAHEMATLKARGRLLRYLIGLLGPTRTRAEVKPVDVQRVLATVRLTGVPREPRISKITGKEVRSGGRRKAGKPLDNGTLNRYKNGLQNFFTVLGGKQAYNPVKDVPDFPEHSAEAPPPKISLALFDRILDAMPDHYGRGNADLVLNKLRLNVIAFAGLPQKQIGLIEERHIDWDAQTVMIQGRKKGGWTSLVEQPIGTHGMAALRALVDAGGLGEFSTSNMWRGFKKGLAKVDPSLDLSPYKLRHLFGTVALDESEDQDTVQRLMQHHSKATNRIYTKAAHDKLKRRAIAFFDQAVERQRAEAAARPKPRVLAAGVGKFATSGTKKAVNDGQ